MQRKRLSLWSLVSLRGRLLFLICFATLPALLFTAYATQNERTAALVRAERDALHVAGIISREHAQQIRGARELLSWLGAKLAREGLQSTILADPDFLPALLAGHPQLANIGVLTPDGRVLRSAYPLSVERSWGDNPAFVAARRSDAVEAGTYIISPIFKRPTLNHAYAVRDTGRRVTAVVFSGLDLEWLSNALRQSGSLEGFSVLITDREGRVLAEGGAATPLASGADVRIPGVADLSRSGHGRVVETDDEGRRYLVATQIESLPGVYVAVSLPYEQLVGEANTAFSRALAGLGILSLLTIVAAFTAAEVGFLRSLRSLARTARRFGGGDLAARAPVPRGHDEFSSLASAFNTMADSLVSRHHDAVGAQVRLRALASSLQVAREAEAARISRELHDEIGQLLTSLKIELVRLQSHCPAGDQSNSCATALRSGVVSMNGQIATALDFVRRISSELRPGVLDRLGLAAALEWQAREIEARTDLAVQVEADGVSAALDELVSVTLFRIAQEALTNVVRYAEARVVEVHLHTTEDGVRLEVRDDGKGIAPVSIESSDSLGIIGMRERVRLINGQLSIHGAPGQGTKVIVTAPLARARESAHAHPAG